MSTQTTFVRGSYGLTMGERKHCLQLGWDTAGGHWRRQEKYRNTPDLQMETSSALWGFFSFLLLFLSFLSSFLPFPPLPSPHPFPDFSYWIGKSEGQGPRSRDTTSSKGCWEPVLQAVLAIWGWLLDAPGARISMSARWAPSPTPLAAV